MGRCRVFGSLEKGGFSRPSTKGKTPAVSTAQLLLSCVFTAPLLLLMVADMWPGGSALTRLLDRRVPGLGQVTWDALPRVRQETVRAWG